MPEYLTPGVYIEETPSGHHPIEGVPTSVLGLVGPIERGPNEVREVRFRGEQDDIYNGRLICLIGVAPVRPAEFVIFRIGQKTLDASG